MTSEERARIGKLYRPTPELRAAWHIPRGEMLTPCGSTRPGITVWFQLVGSGHTGHPNGWPERYELNTTNIPRYLEEA